VNKTGEREKIIFGGTFDPIHIGHLLIAEQTCEQLKCGKTHFIPAGNPPHKERSDLTPAEIRYEMAAEAISDNDRFEISDMELGRDGPSYTARTIEEFREAGYDVSIIMGADSLAEIFSWRDPQYILSEARILVAQRPGYDIEAMKNNPFYTRCEAEITKIETGFFDISSSLIRKRIKSGLSIKYMVPDIVEKIIRRERLYID